MNGVKNLTKKALFLPIFCMLGHPATMDEIYPAFYRKALEGEPDCGGFVIYNFLAGEPVAGVPEGRPMLFWYKRDAAAPFSGKPRRARRCSPCPLRQALRQCRRRASAQ